MTFFHAHDRLAARRDARAGGFRAGRSVCFSPSPEPPLGNKAAQRLFQAARAETRLPISQPGDPYERDAERMAGSALSRDTQSPGSNLADAASGTALPGRPVWEKRFGHDLKGVRVHADSGAARMAHALRADAFTVGRDIFLRDGRSSLAGDAGRRLLAHELAHVVQQSAASPAPGGLGTQVVRRTPALRGIYRQGSRFQVRSPTLEIAALRSQAAFGIGRGQPLLPAEIADATAVFGSSVDLSRVRIVHTPIISAPTTLGDSIRVPPNYAPPRRVLIHELTHIWQFQNKGTAYISDSLFHQAAATILTGDRNAAYNYQIEPGKSFDAYTAEQQATIVEDYFAYPSLQSNPEYQRLIGQVRAARPLPASLSFTEEMAAGLPPRAFDIPSPLGPSPEGGGSVPQLEFRFPGL